MSNLLILHKAEFSAKIFLLVGPAHEPVKKYYIESLWILIRVIVNRGDNTLLYNLQIVFWIF